MNQDLRALNAAIALGDLAWAPVGSKFIWKSPMGDCSAEVVTLEKRARWHLVPGYVYCEILLPRGQRKICERPHSTLTSLPENCPPFAEWLRGEGWQVLRI